MIALLWGVVLVLLANLAVTYLHQRRRAHRFARYVDAEMAYLRTLGPPRLGSVTRAKLAAGTVTTAKISTHRRLS